MRKVQKVTILTYLKTLFGTSAASPGSPDAKPFPDDTEGDVLQPWRMVIITIAAL